MTLRCSDPWLYCETCGARPEQDCQDPDRKEILLSYKGMYAEETIARPALATLSTEIVDDAAGEKAPAISPEHYSRHVIEPIDFIEMNNFGFSVGNAIKYLCRYDAKNGLEDLYKAKRYVEFLIAKELGENPSSAAA